MPNRPLDRIQRGAAAFSSSLRSALATALLLGGVALALGACRRDASSDATKAEGALAVTAIDGEIAVGKPPPDFTARAHDGSSVRLSELRGKPVVVYFYPKDETPGCTKEACAFRDAWDQLDAKGVVLLGVSGDSDASHRAFAEHHKLPFRLISDPDGALAGAFGVPVRLGIPSRQTIVVGRDGNVKAIHRSVDVASHAQRSQDVG